ncbi:MAG: dockerin type I repeat-containing protein, partial [Candidatus Zixiibacteriota bacterium]
MARVFQIPVVLPRIALMVLVAGLMLAGSASARTPYLVDCPADTIWTGLGATVEYQFRAVDPDPEPMINPIRYRLITGPGEIDPLTGLWTYVTTPWDVGKSFEVKVGVTDGDVYSSGNRNCQFHIIVADWYGPMEIIPVPDLTIPWGQTLRRTITVRTHNLPIPCRHITFELVSSEANGLSIVDSGSTWATIEWTPGPQDIGRHTACIRVRDACLSVDTVCVTIEVVSGFRISIEKTRYSIQGQLEQVSIYLDDDIDQPLQMAGFDFLITYDRSALNFQTVEPGPLFSEGPDGCNWEYFTYRRWFWPSYEPHFFWAGLIRVIAIADINNGLPHPACYLLPTPFTLFTLVFLVTDNRLFQCQFAPVFFFWTHCGDNTISTVHGDTLFMSRRVYDRDGNEISTDAQFPTYFGAPEECLDLDFPRHKQPLRGIDFVNGGVDIICADTIDTWISGDLNLNGVIEIADAVIYTNYFIYGLAVFHINTEIQIALSDVNGDGITLDVADLIYLVRIIVGDALPYNRICDSVRQSEAVFIDDTRSRSISIETTDTVGTVYLEFDGNATPLLMHPNMEIKHAFDSDSGVTRVLIYSLEGRSFVQGPIVTYSGGAVLNAASAGTKQGCHMESVIRRVTNRDGLS